MRVLLTLLLWSIAAPAYATCAFPDGVEGEMVYNTTHKVAQFCNGTHWISMAPGSAPATDPRIGTLTNGKWCATDGATVNCTEDPPEGGLAEAAGDSGQIQFNDGSDGLGADAALHWDNANKRLGIGTATPNSTLEVTGDIKFRAGDSLYLGGSDLKYSLRNSGGELYLEGFNGGGPGTSGGFRLRLWDSGKSTSSDVFRIQGNGNVGIGTTNPAYKFDVKGEPSATATLRVQADNGASNSADIQITAGGTGASNIWFGDGAASGSSSPGRLYYAHSADALIAYTNSAERVRIDSSGNVGIGTTSPTGKLSIEGAFNGWARTTIKNVDAGTNAGAGVWAFNDNSTGYAIFGVAGTGYTTFPLWQDKAVLDAGALTSGLLLHTEGVNPIIFGMVGNEKMRIDSTGNVGIGIIAPNEKLVVSGKVKADEFCNSSGTCIDIGSVAAIPTGAIMAFDLTTCPTGWAEYTTARGRFLRGIDNGAGNDPDGTRVPGSIQTDELKSHRHAMNEFGAYGAGGSSQNTFNNLGSLRYTDYEGGAETRPKNVAVLFCRKN